MTRNEILKELVEHYGGTATEPTDRNQLLRDLLTALQGG